MGFHHPEQISYIKSELYETRKHWADFYQESEWNKTYFFKDTNIGEGWSNAMKKSLGKNTIPLVGLIDFIHKFANSQSEDDLLDYNTNKTLSSKHDLALKEELVKKGWRNIMENIEAVTGDDPFTLNRIYEIIKESLDYEIDSETSLFSREMYKSLGYGSPTPSDENFISLFSKRVLVEPALKQKSKLFKYHENPPVFTDDRKPVLFVVKKANGEGEGKCLMFYDGALVCSCSEFHQVATWCKHAYVLARESRIDFNASLALDKFYHGQSILKTTNSSTFLKNQKTDYQISKPLSWAAETLRKIREDELI